MPHQATVTGKTGPDRTNTAVVINNVSRIDLQLSDKRLQIYTEPGGGSHVKEYDLNVTTAITVAISNGNYTVTVS